LKSLAKELDVPIIVSSQLSRAVEMREDKHPRLSDLRESGSIEQDADIVLFLYRPSYYGITEDELGNDISDITEIKISKHRNGPIGEAKIKFIGTHVKFIN
jgi:replicative DNA helicase